MKVAIVDDETHCIESLSLHLQSLFPDLQIVYKSNSAIEALRRLPELKIDLLFLDVEMPILNGFELLEQLGNTSFDIMFTTAYSKYALQAFKYHVSNYLLKPIDENELNEAIIQWQNHKNENFGTETVTNLLEYLKKNGILKNKIAIPVLDGLEFINVDEIMYCQSKSNYTNLFLKNGNELLISQTLKEAEKILNPYFFIRAHQSFVINPNYMRKYQRHDGGSIIMADGKVIPIGSNKKELITGIFETIRKTL